MILPSLVTGALALVALPQTVQATLSKSFAPATRDPICLWISHSISSASNVYYPGEELYDKGVRHWATSASEVSKCVVEPGTPADIGAILRIVGVTRSPFAVKGSGHSPNPKFASTTGVHISMYRFNSVNYNAAAQTVEVGAGLVWDDVYRALEPHGVNVVGARVPDVGVAGLTLGGGLSWKTNRFGWTVDTVVAFELVKPNGQVVKVTHEADPKLFMGLKGGFNNFGIVTKFTLKTHEQTEVWGGPMQIAGEHFDALIAATVEFTDNVNDPKAQMMTTYSYSQGRVACALVLFYDGPTAPTGMFDAFLAIPSIQSNVKTRSFLDLIGATPTGPSYGFRGIFSGFNVLDSTVSLLNFIIKEAEVRGKELAAKSGIVAAYAVTPFHSSIYSHNTQTTAFPPDRVTPYIPFNMYYSWLNATYDNDFYDTARASAQTITNAAIAEGQSISPNAAVYPNNAMFGTPLERIYGDNLPTLRALKRRVDPLNVMGLAGGFKF